jgi:hypothetical protein
MDLVLAICQALGLGLALGIGGPLVALFIAAMAALEAGIDPSGTDWEFLGAEWFLLLMLVANVIGFYTDRNGQANPTRTAGFAGAIGAIAGAAALAAEGEPAAIGFVVGAAAGILAGLIAGQVLAGAQARAERNDAAAPSTLTLIFAAAGIAVAALSLFVPPVSIVVLVALIGLALSRRRKAGEKYEGLRVLR